jgi:hypothetical protein
MVYRYAQPKETLAYAAMAVMPAPSTNILAATSDGVVRYVISTLEVTTVDDFLGFVLKFFQMIVFCLIRFLDIRTKSFAYEWKTSLTTSGKQNFLLFRLIYKL